MRGQRWRAGQPDKADRRAQAARGRPPHRHHDPYPCPRVLAQSVGDLTSTAQRKVLSPNDFTDAAHLAATLEAFIGRYNRTTTPFGWRYTSTDLRRSLPRTETRANRTHSTHHRRRVNHPDEQTDPTTMGGSRIDHMTRRIAGCQKLSASAATHTTGPPVKTPVNPRPW